MTATRAERTERLESLVGARLERLLAEHRVLAVQCREARLQLRPRIYRLDADIIVAVPGIENGWQAEVCWREVADGRRAPVSIVRASSAIVALGPRAALRALRRIAAATDHCRRVSAGVARHMAEIERQQHRVEEALDAELAIEALAKG